jgi:cobyrinic acid a,c-diamide synthase
MGNLNNRILIAGSHSGCGKTTVICAALGALKKRGVKLSAFKCGPDYIDPMFHRRVLGVPSRNLDPFFCGPELLRRRLSEAEGDVSLLEGAMGYYDGIGPEGRYGAYDVARETKTPVALVIDAKGAYASTGALISGFLRYREQSQIKGVIFNNASPALYGGLSSIAEKVGVKPLGFLPTEVNVAIQSRHLGLTTAEDIPDLKEKLDLLCELAERYIDIDALLELAAAAPPLVSVKSGVCPLGSARVAVARDGAFCFTYEENLEALKALGCELAFFSPLSDEVLPEGASGLYLCGGYPELHLKELSENVPMLKAVREAARAGTPTIAECGGFLYLHDAIDGVPMAGVVRARARKTGRLQRFGYVELIAQRDNLLCAAGESSRSHEFHYYESSDRGADFIAKKPLSEKSWPCARGTQTLYAGFPHLYFDSNPAFAENFVRKVLEYATANSK